MVLSPGEASRWESGAAKSPSGEREGEAGQTRGEFSRRQNVQVSVEQRWLFVLCDLPVHPAGGEGAQGAGGAAQEAGWGRQEEEGPLQHDPAVRRWTKGPNLKK